MRELDNIVAYGYEYYNEINITKNENAKDDDLKILCNNWIYVRYMLKSEPNRNFIFLYFFK